MMMGSMGRLPLLMALGAAGLMTAVPLFAKEVVVEGKDGECYVVEVGSEESFEHVVAKIGECLIAVNAASDEAFPPPEAPHIMPVEPSIPVPFRLLVSSEGKISAELQRKQTSARNYNASLDSSKRDDIAYIVKTLANSSLVKIKKSESSLKKAGDRVDGVHPLQFLACIFGDEELKVSMRNLHGRSWVWKRFLNGLTGSLGEENALGNLLPFASDFAGKVSIDVQRILPSLQSGQWESFINILIKEIPRKGDSGRYNM